MNLEASPIEHHARIVAELTAERDRLGILANIVGAELEQERCDHGTTRRILNEAIATLAAAQARVAELERDLELTIAQRDRLAKRLAEATP